MHCLLFPNILDPLFPFTPLHSPPWLPTQASSFTFQPSILLNSSSMQCRSTPSLAPPSSCYPIPHSQIVIPPCIPCITSTNLLPKRIKSVALINEGGGWINFKILISDSGVHTKCTTTDIWFGHPLFGYNCIYPCMTLFM